MAFEKMSELDQKVIGECLRAALFFLGEDLYTVSGVEEDHFLEIVDGFPNVSDSDEDVYLAINNALVNTVGYPHGFSKRWNDFISVSLEEVFRVHARWQALKETED